MSFVLMNIKGPSMEGAIRAFLRPTPRKQKSFADIRRIITAGEFGDQHAFIVGGSRGLGEVTAKMLAAGGARVVLTYFRGSEDAQDVANEIASAGGLAGAMQFNSLAARETLVDEEMMGELTHLYYFATPPIVASASQDFSPKLFNAFCNYYVSGFSETVDVFCEYAPSTRRVFFPSSVLVDDFDPRLSSYTLAKVAGEALCSILEKTKRDISIHRPRLPRMATDQTASLISIGFLSEIGAVLVGFHG